MRPDPGQTDRDRELFRAIRGLLDQAGDRAHLQLVGPNGVGDVALVLHVKAGGQYHRSGCHETYEREAEWEAVAPMDAREAGPSRAVWVLERALREWKGDE